MWIHFLIQGQCVILSPWVTGEDAWVQLRSLSLSLFVFSILLSALPVFLSLPLFPLLLPLHRPISPLLLAVNEVNPEQLSVTIYQQLYLQLYLNCSANKIDCFDVITGSWGLQSVLLCGFAHLALIVWLLAPLRGLLPEAEPCFARFCINRFWQLCNFCYLTLTLEDSYSAV